MKLSVKSFAITCGTLFGLSFKVATWWLIAKGTPGDIMIKFSNFFFGYSFSYIGGIIGLLWGFVHGFIFCGVFSWVYNKFVGTKNP